MHKALYLSFGRRLCWHVTLNHHVGVSVHFGTARFAAGAYTSNMHRVSIQAVIAMLWVVAVTIAGIVGSEPRQSMSQSIQEALR